MPGKDALGGQQLGKGGAVRGTLADRLVEEDHAADELLDALRREEQLAVGAPVLLGGLDRDRVEALLDGGRALVGGEDSLAGRHHGARRLGKFRHLYLRRMKSVMRGAERVPCEPKG